MSEISNPVYCIVDKRTKALFEVCATLQVALDHCEQECYKYVKELGIEVEIVKRAVWIA